MDSHQLFERYGASLASLQAQLASMETKQIAYENITNKKLFDLASRIGFQAYILHSYIHTYNHHHYYYYNNNYYYHCYPYYYYHYYYYYCHYYFFYYYDHYFYFYHYYN